MEDAQGSGCVQNRQRGFVLDASVCVKFSYIEFPTAYFFRMMR
jgi:hypothetical protein